MPTAPAPPERPTTRRSARWLAGAGIAVTAALLWPFAGWSGWPILAGLGAMVVLYLLRVDRLLRGWAPHLAGLLTVFLLVAHTGPWAWGLALGLAVLGAGLVRLPRWRLLTVGLVLTLGFGVGYAVTEYHAAAARDRQAEQARAAGVADVMAIAPRLVLPGLLTRVATDDAAGACAALTPPAKRDFAAAVRAPDCEAAVHQLARQVTDPRAYVQPDLPDDAVTEHPGGTATVDGCRASWTTSGSAPGPRLGRFELRRSAENPGRYLIVGYAPCR